MSLNEVKESALKEQKETLVAQAIEPAKEMSSTESLVWNFVPMILIMFVFYFLVFRPNEQKRKEQDDMIKGIKRNDNVLLNSGIYGVVVKIDNEDAFVEIADDVEIKVLKTSIVQVLETKKTLETNKPKSKVKSKNKKASEEVESEA
jgi:preprotein translocase subunit YajC